MARSWQFPRAPLMHTCPAPGCKVEIPRRLLACKTHWLYLPERLRKRIWNAYKPGQERADGPTPSPEYREALREACEVWRGVGAQRA